MKKLLDKIVDVRAAELRALCLAFVFSFVVLGSYNYDSQNVSGGVRVSL